MTSSRRSSKSTKSNATTRSARPPAWRATSIISGTAPGPPLKNSSAPEVSVVIAEPETISNSTSASAASKLAPTISRHSSSSGVNRRLIVERTNSTRTRLQDVFRDDELSAGSSNVGFEESAYQPATGSSIAFPSSSFPSSSVETTYIPSAHSETAPIMSSSPGRASWFSSFGRSKGKEKATDHRTNISPDAHYTLESVQQDTPKAASQSLSAVPLDGGSEVQDNTVEPLGSTPSGACTIRPTSSPPVGNELDTPRVELPSFTGEDLSRTIRATEGPKQPNDPSSQKHSWFNPFAPYPSHSQPRVSSQPPSTSASISTSPIASSPLSRASSSHIGSIDDEVPSLIRTPTQLDDEGQRLRQIRDQLTSTVTPEADISAVDSNPQAVTAFPENGQTPRARKRLDSLNSLNPSTSRFSISIPLLGRPKMRLEDAVKLGKESDDQDGGDASTDVIAAPNLISEVTATTKASSTSNSTTTTTAEGQSDSPMSKPATIPTSDEAVVKDSVPPSAPVQPENESVNATQPSQPHDATTASAQSQSWWSYIGWYSSQPSAEHPELPPTLRSPQPTSSENETFNLQVPADLIRERSSSAPPVMEPSNDTVLNNKPLKPENNLPANVSSPPPQLHSEIRGPGKSPSIFSLDVARAAGSWFNPWTWYDTSDALESQPTPTAAANDASPNGSEDDGGAGNTDHDTGDENDDGGEKKKLTESEKIKEAALARDNHPSAGSPSSEPTVTTDLPSAGEASETNRRPSSHSEPMNPIADSASSLRSGWASFFSMSRGRGLVIKNLGETAEPAEPVENSVKKDENGVEIMELTDDEAGSVNVQEPEPGPQPESEKAVTKVPTSTAIALIRALAGPDTGKPMMIEAKEKKNQDDNDKNSNLPLLPPSPQPSSKSKGNADTPATESLPASPTKRNPSRPGRASSVSTTRTGISSIGNKPAPPLTISDDIKASVAAAKKSKRAGASPARVYPGNTAGPSSLPKDGITTPSGQDLKKEKLKSHKSGTSTPVPSPPPNLVLPTWKDTFHTLPRSWVPDHYLPASSNVSGGFGSTIGKTMKYMSGILLGVDSGYTSGGETSRFGVGAGATKRRSRRASSRRRSISRDFAIPGVLDGTGISGEAELMAREREKFRQLINWGQNLPRAWDVIDAAIESRNKPPTERKGKSKAVLAEDGPNTRIDVTRGCRKVVIIGIHGWFPGAVMRSMLGEPTGTSPKFVNMMEQALEEFQLAHGVEFDKITKIPLEGEGTIDGRVEKLYANLLSNDSWVEDLHNADVIFVATHSQGSVVSTHLLDRLIRDRHIRTSKNAATESISGIGVNVVSPPAQRVCCLCLCGIHLGPLRYLSTSSLVQPYIQYFESAAARELFEFQNTDSDVSKAYVQALRNVVYNETKMVYVASLNDQVVPIYSGLFTSASHPLILRALYIDGDAYNSSDFLTNLLVLLLRVLNCGLSDSGLLAHLSEVTAGSLNGIGHSTAYEELSTFSLAVNYLFLANSGFEDHPELAVEPFNASIEMNDYEIPWALRDLIADEKIAYYFSQEITQLRDAFREWHPKTTPLRDIKRKLQPIQRLPSTTTPGTANSSSKL
ncbi:hypothetical protein GYMLUDRAFT_38877 [Collybiopsis luxurians FD-317 M1]|nr:hypothetical protein GYMLUDRAFT_38877 [Collybiopsis luxurians FD-317 M1]